MSTTISFPAKEFSTTDPNRSTASEQVAYLHLLSTILQRPLETLIDEGILYREPLESAAA